jgi:hypothetical protein
MIIVDRDFTLHEDIEEACKYESSLLCKFDTHGQDDSATNRLARGEVLWELPDDTDGFDEKLAQHIAYLCAVGTMIYYDYTANLPLPEIPELPPAERWDAPTAVRLLELLSIAFFGNEEQSRRACAIISHADQIYRRLVWSIVNKAGNMNGFFTFRNLHLSSPRYLISNYLTRGLLSAFGNQQTETWHDGWGPMELDRNGLLYPKWGLWYVACREPPDLSGPLGQRLVQTGGSIFCGDSVPQVINHGRRVLVQESNPEHVVRFLLAILRDAEPTVFELTSEEMLQLGLDPSREGTLEYGIPPQATGNYIVRNPFFGEDRSKVSYDRIGYFCGELLGMELGIVEEYLGSILTTSYERLIDLLEAYIRSGWHAAQQHILADRAAFEIYCKCHNQRFDEARKASLEVKDALTRAQGTHKETDWVAAANAFFLTAQLLWEEYYDLELGAEEWERIRSHLEQTGSMPIALKGSVQSILLDDYVPPGTQLTSSSGGQALLDQPNPR